MKKIKEQMTERAKKKETDLIAGSDRRRINERKRAYGRKRNLVRLVRKGKKKLEDEKKKGGREKKLEKQGGTGREAKEEGEDEDDEKEQEAKKV